MAKERRRRMRLADERQIKAAELLAEGKPILHALVEAGYSENTARLGLNGVSDTVMQLIPKSGHGLMQLSRVLSWEDHQHLVLGRLAKNVMDGKDSGSASAKILGGHKSLNMWVSEANINQVMIQLPDIPEEK